MSILSKEVLEALKKATEPEEKKIEEKIPSAFEGKLNKHGQIEDEGACEDEVD